MAVMGVESELIVRAPPSIETAVRQRLAMMTVDLVARVVKTVRALEGANSPAGHMMENGGRIYKDGDFVEIATPEVTTPRHALIYQRACEVIVLAAFELASRNLKLHPGRAQLIRRSSDGAGHFVGFHTSVQTMNCNTAMLVEHLVPMLVTRFYACAGGIGPGGFAMSQKHPAIKTVASPDSRENRGIVHLKDEALALGPSKRVHITHGDACMSDLSVLLTVGATALVVRMLDDGACVGPVYKLNDPVAALRSLDNDPTWSRALPLASGGVASALDIQRHYLKAAERYAAKKGEPWMKSVVEQWRWTIDRLRSVGPAGLSYCLDPYIKLPLYSARLRRHGLSLGAFSRWCAPVELARVPLRAGGEKRAWRDIKGYLRERMPFVRFGFLNERMTRTGLDWASLPRAIAIYEELLALDFKYHDISLTGLHCRLRDAGAINSRLLNEREIRVAMREPPTDTRASARGRAIRDIAAEPGASGNWMEVHSSKRRMRLPDPRVSSGKWEEIAGKARR